MKLVTLTGHLSKRFGIFGAIKMIKEQGFDAYDCSLFQEMEPGNFLSGADYKERAAEIRKYADELGIPCTQTHSPMPWLRTFKDIDDSVQEQKRAIEISAILGAEVVVIHPAAFANASENYEHQYKELLTLAKELGVKIATENMFSWKDKTETETVPSACGTADDFVEYIDFVNDEYFTACLDIGHSEMVNCEGAPKIIRALGHNRVKALHVHDNDCYHDDHTFPYTGKIDWDEVCRALAEIDYTGNFTFEADNFLIPYPDELMPACFALLESTGRYLIKKIESYKYAN